MNVCILGSHEGKLDEGMANVSYYLFKNLQKEFAANNFFLLNTKDIYTPKFWKNIVSFRPHIIHFIPGPTAKGLVLVKLLKILTGSITVVTATKPAISKKFIKISRIFAPDLVLVQSPKSESLFKAMNYRTKFIPNGVDTTKFSPVDEGSKCEFRKQLGFSCDDYIILHVGPARKGRNLHALKEVSAKTGAKLLLIISISNPSEEDILSELEKSGAVVWKRYFKNIEILYAIADLYVFPVFEELNSIDLPLSVLEALSCNLPVVTSRYGGLASILDSGQGLFFAENENDIINHIKEIREGRCGRIDTRLKIVNSFSWKNVATQVFRTYLEFEKANRVKV